MTNEDWIKFLSMLEAFGRLGREGKERLDTEYNSLEENSDSEIYVREAIAQIAELDHEI